MCPVRRTEPHKLQIRLSTTLHFGFFMRYLSEKGKSCQKKPQAKVLLLGVVEEMEVVNPTTRRHGGMSSRPRPEARHVAKGCKSFLANSCTLFSLCTKLSKHQVNHPQHGRI